MKSLLSFLLFAIIVVIQAQEMKRIPGLSKQLNPADSPLTTISVIPLDGSITPTDLVVALLGSRSNLQQCNIYRKYRCLHLFRRIIYWRYHCRIRLKFWGYAFKRVYTECFGA